MKRYEILNQKSQFQIKTNILFVYLLFILFIFLKSFFFVLFWTSNRLGEFKPDSGDSFLAFSFIFDSYSIRWICLNISEKNWR